MSAQKPDYRGEALPAGVGLPHFNRRLNRLIRLRCSVSPEWGLGSHTQLARWMTQAGAKTSGSYVSQMRRGRNVDIGSRRLHALSLALGVSPMVWFDEAIYTEECQRLNPGITRLDVD